MPQTPAPRAAARGTSSMHPDTGLLSEPLLLEVLSPLLALARRNSRALALLHVQVPTSRAEELDVGALLRSSVRDADLVGQLAPARFAVALVEIWDADAAVRVAHRFLDVLGNSEDGDPTGTHVGVAFYPSDARDGRALLDAAVRATPVDEPLGFASPETGRDALRRAGLLGTLSGTRAASEFRLHYQPIRSTRTGDVVGAEALLRWDRGDALLPAAEFIEMARSTGRIRGIELWTMERAFPEVQRWRDAGWDGWVAVNLSGRSLADPRLPTIVEELLESSGLPADAVMFEITERSTLTGDPSSILQLEALRDLGARIAVDDFGAGYASFEYLCDFDPDVVKLDRAFTARSRPRGATDLLSVLVDTVHRLGKPVVVEGVETPAEWDRVSATRPEYVQGYFTGRPVPGPTFIRQHLGPGSAAYLDSASSGSAA